MPRSGAKYVELRGGAAGLLDTWLYRASARYFADPDRRQNDVGFRCAWPVDK
ncbi:MAG TPA: hypothetical protein VJC18_08530 [bacterium]|nr:hypothetical protein [bacterium]